MRFFLSRAQVGLDRFRCIFVLIPLGIWKNGMDPSMNSDNLSQHRKGVRRGIPENHINHFSAEDLIRLEAQNSRLVPAAKAAKLERDAQRHWDIFYKHNETKFFKDRHWTIREFQELINFDPDARIVLLELGCGVGNLVYPLIEEGFSNFYFYACDFSPRAVQFVQNNRLYDESKIRAFQADITMDSLFSNIEEGSVDIVTLIFVLSAIHPDRFIAVARTAIRALRPGGLILFRDYGRYDMTQLRFKPGHKIAEHFYMRQDGTTSYYFTVEEVTDLFASAGAKAMQCDYVYRRTLNVKEKIDAQRVFVQAKFCKPRQGL